MALCGASSGLVLPLAPAPLARLYSPTFDYPGWYGGYHRDGYSLGADHFYPRFAYGYGHGYYGAPLPMYGGYGYL